MKIYLCEDDDVPPPRAVMTGDWDPEHADMEHLAVLAANLGMRIDLPIEGGRVNG